MDMVDPSARGKFVRVEFHTGSYLILGTVPTLGERLIDVLNQRTPPYLTLDDARVQPLYSRGRQGFRTVANLLLKRSDIRIAMPYEANALPSRRSKHPEYVYKQALPARLCLDTMQIDGNIYVKDGEEPLLATQALTGTFLVVTDARLRYLDEACSSPFASNIVIVNRAYVHVIALNPEPSVQAEAGLVRPVASPAIFPQRP